MFDESKKSRYFPDEFNWWEMEQDCDKCRLPMHMASGQDVTFCPNCAIDRRNAKRGRDSLTAAKARDVLKRVASGELCGAFASQMPL